jgi:ABC-type lipoprotein release transport system permease subunit
VKQPIKKLIPMALLYAGKHVVRSWQLFVALLLGILLASAFFAGIDIKANVTTEQAFDQQLSTVNKDFEIMSSSFNLTQLNTIQQQLAETENVKSYEVLSRGQQPATIIDEGNKSTDSYASIVGITENSKVYDGWENKPAALAANETYLAENVNYRYGSGLIKPGDIISFNFSLINPENGSLTVLPLNLTVRGFAQLDDAAYSIVTGSTFFVSPALGASQNPISLPPFFASDSLIVDWDKTVKPFLEAANDSRIMPFQQSVLVYVDRGSLVSAWDLAGSANNLQVLQNNIANKLNTALGFQVSIQNNLLYSVQSFQGTSILLRFVFILISLPIFFMAWYLGTTVSDVSFSSRRREIGLLATKGFSTGQISRIFLFETILIGIVGSLLGVMLGFVLTPLFASSAGGFQWNLETINPYTVVFTMAFGLIMAFLSTYSSSRRAAKLSTVGALHEYLPNEPEHPIRKRLAWLAFILGTYKIVVLIAGINVQTLVNNVVFSGGNFILSLLGVVWFVVDQGLNYFGPLLFFWGFAKLFIQGSLKFQELTVRASKFLGDIGTLATKNVRRKPARAAAMAFLIALIVWYGVLVTGQLSIEQDYNKRLIYANVGADVNVSVGNVSQAQAVLNNVLANVSGVEDATAEYTISTPQGTLKAVDPDGWLKSAYYEQDWFSGVSVEKAFEALKTDNYTIILERFVARAYNLTLGDRLSVQFENGTRSLRVVGFFGPEPQDQMNIQSYYSFIPYDLYADPGNLTSASSQILVRIDSSAQGKEVAQNIQTVDDRVTSVNSVQDNTEKAQSNVITTGALEVQQLGILFAVLAASVGTALISVVSMRERSREATILSVKGLSYKQLVIMFLTENFALVTFAIVLGLSVGLVSVYGNMSASNAQTLALVMRHFIFPLDSTLLVTSYIVLIFAATVLPVIIMSRKYVTQLERMVRLR